MSDQWLYRIRGQEFGPVSLDLVRTLVAAGTIAVDDEVRDVNSSKWTLACAAAELCGPANSGESEPGVERRIGRDDWYCRGYSGEFGPLSMSELIQLAADGELQPDEEIKSRVDDYWRQINSIRRLVELLPFADLPRAGNRAAASYVKNEPVQAEPADILPFPGVWSQRQMPDEQINDLIDQLKNFLGNEDADEEVTRAAGPSSDSGAAMRSQRLSISGIAADPMVAAETLNEDRWSGWMAGQEFGPVSFSQLLSWAVTGRLAPTDFVRKGDDKQFVPAVNVPCLFTVEKAASSLARRVYPTDIRLAALPCDLSEIGEGGVSTDAAETDVGASLSSRLFRIAQKYLAGKCEEPPSEF